MEPAPTLQRHSVPRLPSRSISWTLLPSKRFITKTRSSSTRITESASTVPMRCCKTPRSSTDSSASPPVPKSQDALETIAVSRSAAAQRGIALVTAAPSTTSASVAVTRPSGAFASSPDATSISGRYSAATATSRVTSASVALTRPSPVASPQSVNASAAALALATAERCHGADLSQSLSTVWHRGGERSSR